jgi:ABC-type dipeptide/oligopeptide/nickel transport system ATPase subunit
MKIKELKIKGIRGIREEISLTLNGNSLLLYGDNGSGKSSITDAIEWFYHDKVSNLSNEEIDKRGGVSALRNTFLPDNQNAEISILFSDHTPFTKKLNPRLQVTKLTDDYIENSKKENLILRYSDLMSFVLASKTEKLKYLSSIIGFDDVSKCKEVLKTGLNYIKTKFKSKNFDDEISRRNGNILQVLGESVTSDEHFVNKINELVKDLGETVQTFEDIDITIEKLKKIDDSPVIKEREYLQEVINKINDFKGRLTNLYSRYAEFYALFQEIKSNINNLKNITLNNLWKEALKILTEKGVWQQDVCPLCEQTINREKLSESLKERLENIKIIRDKNEKLESLRKEAKKFLDDEVKPLRSTITKKEFYKNETEENLKNIIDIMDKYLSDIEGELNKDVRTEMIKPVEDIKFTEIELNKAVEYCQQKHIALERELKSKKVFEIQDKLIQAKRDYKEIKILKKEKEVLEKIKSSLEKIYNTFVQKQKEELEQFIRSFSDDITKYYEYMHHGEPIKSFSISPIIDEDELKGITLEYEFFGQKVSPPQKYLSESHLNSLGIAFFLASVKAFNKVNKFFILDDIISSFDSDHRTRLSNLLLEHFKEYQLIILTHEKNWFEYMKHTVKGKNDWIINAVNWSEGKGTHLNESLTDLRRLIESRLTNNEIEGLGNIIRKYLEGFLKEICEKIEVRVKYLSNEKNETRMANELLSELKSLINKQPCKDQISPSIEKLLVSKFIADKDSHSDPTYTPSTGDIRALWDDVLDLYKKLYCKECLKTISAEFYDNVSKKIQCKCGQLTYEWKI